ncbi:Cytoplasmic dynein 2 heavy chain 1 [Fasciola gigantica]|uniref:Cytoplasmic dynein 2 heavy chain 1 n=1 Tax=Fasciola gigantica TaxID=46835 RepID=A0A504YNG6_FASGI|nr:Cytoplasmic dynein 2 heavy chain 1 [Fasciola gigantica]
MANFGYETTGESPPDPTRPLDVQVDPKQPNRLIPYPPGANVALLVPATISAGGTGACQEISSSTLTSNSVVARQVADSLVSGHPPLVLTPDVRRAIDSFRCCLLLDYCFCAASRPVQVATVQCSAQTTPAQLLEKLSQLCITVTSSNASGGRVLRPREGERLILYLRDLNLPKPDKWGSCQLTAFLQQLLTYHGYYDPSSLEFVGIEGIQFVGSFTPATTSAGLGRHHLSARFTSALRLAVIDYPDKEQLIAIYSTLLQAVVYSCTTPTNLSESGGKFFERTSDRAIRSSESTTPPFPASRLHVMATIMVDLLNTVQQHFRADEHAHCVFTPHVLTSWTVALWRYDQLHGKDTNAIWAVFGYEARRLFRDRVPGERARGQFDTLITGLLYKHLTGSDLNSNGSSRSSSDRKVHSGPSVDLQLALKFATGEIDGEDEEEDAELSSGGVKDTVTRAGSNNDDLLLTMGWFTTWGALDPVHAECPIPLHGRPLGFVNSVQTRDTIHRGLIQLAREHCPRSADLVLFPEFVDLVCRLDRALSVPAGSVLLAGRAGIGRRSALTLVAHLHQFHVCHLRVGRDYGMRQFTTDVKAACQAAGLEDKRTLLCIEDQQITDDGILEIINSLLASGEALGIMTAEELDALSSTVMPASGISLREAAAEAGHRGPLTSFFANRVRANLHIALILDTDDHERFTGCLRANPSFYKCCVTQWLDDWTKRTLLKLPGLIIPSLKSCTEPAKFMQGFVACHISAPHSQLATPRRYWALCAAYGRIEKTHRVQLEAQISRLQAGLTKLREARERVSQLKKSAAEQGAQLTEKQSAADKALEQISAAMQGAAEQRTEMELLRTRVSEESKNLERRKAAIDSELAEIEPLVQQARAAVGSIRPEALSEIRALRAPPDAIRDILEGVLLLMGIRDTSWVSMRGFLAKRGVQEEILNFDARKISPEIRSSVERLLAKNEDSFDPKIARRASVAAAPLATWVRANVQYAVVLERIAPLEAEQAQLRGSLAQTETALTRLAEDLAGVDSKVARLRAVFEQHTSEATRLKAELDRAKETLASAEALVGELEGEHARWKNQVNEVNSKLNALPSLALLSAAFITYLSASPEDVRRKQLAEWSKQFASLGLVLPDTIMAIENATNAEFCVDIRRFLTTERELLAWRNQGLPSDRLSGENAVVILEWSKEPSGTNMCPLIVDPSSRAVNWLKSHLKDQHLEVVNQQSSNFTTTLELAVRFGKCLIIQEVDEIEPILFPILSGKLTSHGSRSTVTLGDKTIDYHPEFRLFLCTRQTPSTVGVVRPACASSLVTMVNFETTRAGLVDQLLATSLQHERPELEQRRQELVRAEEGMKLELAQLEDNLLEELANARGNILENKELLQSLNRTKQSSLTIAESLTESARLQSELDKERNVFYPLAEAGSRVYFVLTDIVKINWMYQFSLKSFLHLFQRALEAPHDPSLPANERMSFLQKRLEALVYEHVLQSLFKADRLMFTLHMARCLRPGAITDEEWAFFTGLSVAEPTTDESAAPKWLDPERVRDVMRLKAALPELYATLRLDDARIWSNWMNQNEVELSAAPTALQLSQKQGLLTPFHLNVLAVQALRPDRLHTALDHFATRCLNLPQLGPSTLNLSRLYESETRFNEPILLLISPGADPSQELAEAAAIHFDRVTGSKSQSDTRGCLELPSRYRHVAMGQGQADLALEELRSAAEAGDWLCLKNLHLVVGWLPILEKEINTLLLAHEAQPIGSSSGAQNAQPTGQPVVHKDFRLWLTAEPHPGFPSALLQSCLKVAYEAPPGLKRNLRRTYESWSRAYLAQGNSTTRATALATLAWFHAVVQERRSYIPQGWTKFYEFSLADLRVAADIIDRLMLDTDSAGGGGVKDAWAWIHGLFGEAIYGGRMDNPFDTQVLQSYLHQMFSGHTVRSQILGPLQLPGTTELRDYTLLIDSLPEHDLPSYFNLPANIDRSAQRNAGNRVIAQLRLLKRNVGPVSGFDKTVWSQELGPILILWKKLNQNSQLIQSSHDKRTRKPGSTAKKISPGMETTKGEPPVLQFLRLEWHNALRLVQTVHSGLASLSRACRGAQLVTASLHKLAESLIRGETPKIWLDEWPEGSLEPVTFLRDLVRKSNAVQNWLERAETDHLIQSTSPALDLADLFRPSTFLNAVRQQTARQMDVPIDSLKLASLWPDGMRGSSETQTKSITIRVTNLKLEGALFESGHLTPSHPESPSLTHLPDICLMWIPKFLPDFVNSEESISVPVYLDSARDCLVTNLRIPCAVGTQDRWIQAGTALLLSSF